MSVKSEKITDLLQQKRLSYSFEVTPQTIQNEIEAFDREMRQLDCKPVFFAITWHAKQYKGMDLDIAPLRLAKRFKSEGKNVMLHLSCDLLGIPFLTELLNFLQENGICNLFVVLGEHYSRTESTFKSTSSLIKFIRRLTGDYFCIGVAGFPDGDHNEQQHLKEKIDAGADFIVTQAFFEPETFTSFRSKCDEMGINVPIVPGLFLFETLQQLQGFGNKCKVKVSDAVLKRAAEADFSSSEMFAKLIRDISNGRERTNVHFFTLNKLKFVSTFVKNHIGESL